VNKPAVGGWRLALWGVIVLAAAWFLYSVRGILAPFLLGWVIAIVLEPAVRWLRLRGMPRMAAVLLLTVVFFGLATLVVVKASPLVAGQISSVRDQLVKVTQGLAEGDQKANIYTNWSPAVRAAPDGASAMVDDLLDRYGDQLNRAGLPSNRQAIVEQYVEPQRENLVKALQGFVNGFFGIVAGAAQSVLLLAITPLIVFYLLNDMDRMGKRAATWIPVSIRKETLSLIGEVGGVFRSYLRGISLLVLMYSAAAALLLGILGVPFFIILAALAGLLYLIPMFGSLISTVLIFVVCLVSGQSGPAWTSFGSPIMYAIICTVAFSLLSSFVFDQIIVPQVIGGAVELHPLFSIFVITAAGALFGVPGMLLAFPVAGSIKVILDRLLRVVSQPPPALAGLPSVPMRHRVAED